MPRVERDTLVKFLDEYLSTDRIHDESINGLQVEGAEHVSKVALATDAALAVYQQAASHGCEMIIAHHGIIWGGLKRIVGRNYRHLKALLDANVNLYASHLPLDLHAECGNNIELARILGLHDIVTFGSYRGVSLGFAGKLDAPHSLEQLSAKLSGPLATVPLALPFGRRDIVSCAIVSGGGSSALEEAILSGYDCFITGEGAHQNHHMALEGGINMMLLGHYASETVGVKALGRKLEERFGIETVFIDVPTIL